MLTAIFFFWGIASRRFGGGVPIDGSGQAGQGNPMIEIFFAFLTASAIAYILFNNIGF